MDEYTPETKAVPYNRLLISADGDKEEAARLFHTLYNTIERPVSGTLGGRVAVE